MPVTIDKFEYPSDVLRSGWVADLYMFGRTNMSRCYCILTGVTESQVFTDLFRLPHTFSAVGNAQISTAQSKFGGSSYLGDVNGDYITCLMTPLWTLALVTSQ